MLKIPESVIASFSSFLKERNIPITSHNDYKKLGGVDVFISEFRCTKISLSPFSTTLEIGENIVLFIIKQ